MVLQAQRRRKVSNYLLKRFQGNICLCRTKCMTILSYCDPSQSIYTETAWPDLLLLVWKLHQHSQELEKKPLITQTCHNHLKDVSLKAIFPKWHRQTWAVGSKASALLCEHSLLLFGKSWDHCATHSVFPRLLFLVVENTQKASCVGRIHIRFTSQSSA